MNTGLDLLAKKLDEQTIALQELDALQKLVDSHLTKGRHISVPPAAQINVDDLVEFLASQDVWNKPQIDLQKTEFVIEYSGENYHLRHLFDTPAFLTKEPEEGCRCEDKSCIDLSFLHGVEVNNANSWISKSKSTKNLIAIVLVGRHDVRTYHSNSTVAQVRAECVGALFNFSDLPIRHASGINRNSRNQLSEGELAEDRRVEIYVIFQERRKDSQLSFKDNKYELSQQ